MTGTEIAQALHISRTIACGFSPVGRRRVLAAEKRIRRHAQRLGFAAAKTRAAVGGWQLISRQTGTVVAGPGLPDWELEEMLDRLEAERART